MKSYAEFAGPCPNSYIPYIQELLTFDATALDCCDLVRADNGLLCYRTLPSSLHWSRQTEWPWAIETAELRYHYNCLEVGGGGCVMKYPVAKRCNSVVVADVNEEDMHHTKKAVNLLGFENITVVKGDARSLPFPDNWFDRVFCISVLEHIPDNHIKGVEEMIRVLKPGGMLLLTMDVVTQGKPYVDNFFLDTEAAINVVKALGIEKIHCPPNAIRGWLHHEQVELGILMAKYVKPE